MKLTSREQVASLAKFKSDRFLTTSFYLDTDKSRLTKKQIALSNKNLLSQHKTTGEDANLGKAKRESLKQDHEKIDRFCKDNLNSHNVAGLAIFSCSKESFWQVFNLPDPPLNRIVIDQDPYVRPLSAIINEHLTVCLLTFDRKEAKWYELFVGEIAFLEHLTGDVPSKVREGGWEGYDSKRIERHIASHLHDYLKEVARITFDFFKKNSFDWLFLGCKEEYGKEFEPMLHPYVRERLKAYLKVNPGDSPSKILKEASNLEKRLKHKEETELLERFVSELERGGLATSGLKDTLRSLNRGEVQTLLITRHVSKPGKACPGCGYLFADDIKCQGCQRKTERLLDVMDEAVEAAMAKKSQVVHINPPSKLSRFGDIGALLRYKP
jgi:peptide subunit release factor 1 (eRF1)